MIMDYLYIEQTNLIMTDDIHDGVL